MSLTVILPYLAVFVLGWIAKHFGLSIPGMGGSTPSLPSVPSGSPTTGRPLLDLAVAALLKAEAGSPTAQAAIVAEAAAVKAILDAAGVPNLSNPAVPQAPAVPVVPSK